MNQRERRHEQGSAMLIAVMLMVLMGLIGAAALETVSRDRQVAGYQFRKKAAFYAAEAGVSKALETLITGGTASVPTTSLGDTSMYPHGQPAYSFDGPAADAVDDLGKGAYPGMNLSLGQDGTPKFVMQMYRIRVRGTAPGGSLSKLEIATGILAANN